MSLPGERVVAIVRAKSNPDAENYDYEGDQLLDALIVELKTMFPRVLEANFVRLRSALPRMQSDLFDRTRKKHKTLGIVPFVASHLGFIEVLATKNSDIRVLYECGLVLLRFVEFTRISIEVVFFDNYEELMKVYFPDGDIDAEKYPFKDVDEIEGRKLVLFANFTRIVVTLLSNINGKKAHIGKLVNRIVEGDVEYKSGSKMKPSARRRQFILEMETGVKPTKRAVRLYEIANFILRTDSNDFAESVFDACVEGGEDDDNNDINDINDNINDNNNNNNINSPFSCDDYNNNNNNYNNVQQQNYSESMQIQSYDFPNTSIECSEKISTDGSTVVRTNIIKNGDEEIARTVSWTMLNASNYNQEQIQQWQQSLQSINNYPYYYPNDNNNNSNSNNNNNNNNNNISNRINTIGESFLNNISCNTTPTAANTYSNSNSNSNQFMFAENYMDLLTGQKSQRYLSNNIDQYMTFCNAHSCDNSKIVDVDVPNTLNNNKNNKNNNNNNNNANINISNNTKNDNISNEIDNESDDCDDSLISNKSVGNIIINVPSYQEAMELMQSNKDANTDGNIIHVNNIQCGGHFEGPLTSVYLAISMVPNEDGQEDLFQQYRGSDMESVMFGGALSMDGEISISRSVSRAASRSISKNSTLTAMVTSDFVELLNHNMSCIVDITNDDNDIDIDIDTTNNTNSNNNNINNSNNNAVNTNSNIRTNITTNEFDDFLDYDDHIYIESPFYAISVNSNQSSNDSNSNSNSSDPCHYSQHGSSGTSDHDHSHGVIDIDINTDNSNSNSNNNNNNNIGNDNCYQHFVFEPYYRCTMATTTNASDETVLFDELEAFSESLKRSRSDDLLVGDLITKLPKVEDSMA